MNRLNNKRSRFVDLCINSTKSSKIYVHIISAKWNHSNSLIEVANKLKKRNHWQKKSLIQLNCFSVALGICVVFLDVTPNFVVLQYGILNHNTYIKSAIMKAKTWLFVLNGINHVSKKAPMGQITCPSNLSNSIQLWPNKLLNMVVWRV